MGVFIITASQYLYNTNTYVKHNKYVCKNMAVNHVRGSRLHGRDYAENMQTLHKGSQENVESHIIIHHLIDMLS